MTKSYLDADYDGFVGFASYECRVRVPNGYLVFPSKEVEPLGVSYVRFTDGLGIEQVY